jgi:hypothetical protein
VLSRDEVRALALRHQLLDDEEFILDLPKAAWRLDPDPAAAASTPRTCKIGGGADMATHEDWPMNDAGVPYTLLAQIDCARLPALDGEWGVSTTWHHRDMLIRVFADCAHVDGTDAVVLEAAPGTEVHRREPPPLPQVWPCELPPQDFGLGANGEVPEAAFRATPFLSVVVPGSAATGAEASEEYREWAVALANDGNAWEQDASTLVGEPSAAEFDPRESVARRYETEGDDPRASDPAPSLADPAEWAVLLHVASDERFGFDYGGIGTYTVLVPAAELAAGRYEHAVCVGQF